MGTADPRRECEVEQALVDHIRRFLLDLGSGSAFVGRQVPLAFASRDYFLDLLFYHLKQRCYVVIELKAFIGEFQAARRLSGSTEIKDGQIFRVGLTRLRLGSATDERVETAAASANATRI